MLQDALLENLEMFGWEVQAWAVFSNHYHYVAFSPQAGSNVMALTKRLHASTALALNRMDGMPGRRVWFQAWDTAITYDNSYLARLAYVHHNAVRHGLVGAAELYPWCSASWFAQRADRAWFESVTSFPIDSVNVQDDYEPASPQS